MVSALAVVVVILILVCLLAAIILMIKLTKPEPPARTHPARASCQQPRPAAARGAHAMTAEAIAASDELAAQRRREGKQRMVFSPPTVHRWDPELTRTPRGLRWVRTGCAYQPFALGTCRRRRVACPQGPAYCTYYAYQPRAYRTYWVLWHPRWDLDGFEVPPLIMAELRQPPVKGVDEILLSTERTIFERIHAERQQLQPARRSNPNPSPNQQLQPARRSNPNPSPSPSPSPSPKPNQAAAIAAAAAAAAATAT